MRHPNDPKSLDNLPEDNLMLQTRHSGSTEVIKKQIDKLYSLYKSGGINKGISPTKVRDNDMAEAMSK